MNLNLQYLFLFFVSATSDCWSNTHSINSSTTTADICGIPFVYRPYSDV